MAVFVFRCLGAAALLTVLATAACSNDPGTPIVPSPPDAGDGGSREGGPPVPDTTPPVLVRHVPEQGAEDVWGRDPLRLIFSEPLARASFDDAIVTVRAEDALIATRATLTQDGKEIRVALEPTNLGDKLLTVTVANRLTDPAGNVFAGATWSFRLPRWQEAVGATAPEKASGPLRPSLALDKDQNPVVAWQDGARGTLRVFRVVENAWQSLGAAVDLRFRADGFVSAPRVMVGQGDLPILVWLERGDTTHVYAKQFRGEKWELLGTGAIDGATDRESTGAVIAIDRDDRPVVAWISEKARVEVRRWEGNLWQRVGTPWESAATITSIDLALEGSTPVIAVAVTDAVSTDVHVMRWRAAPSTWEPLGPPLDRSLEHHATVPSLAVSAEGVIGIAWQEHDGFTENVYAARFDEASGTWRLWGHALDIDIDAPATAPTIRFAQRNVPVVLWNEGKLPSLRSFVAQFAEGRWEVTGAALGSGARELAVDADSHPVVVREDQGADLSASGVIVHRYNGAPELPYGPIERTAAPCSFPEEGAEGFPRTLSETKCFLDVPSRRPAAGLIPYDVNSPLWSDGALKRRFMILPTDGTFGFTAKNSWQVPIGTILVKEFLAEKQGTPPTIIPMETRFLLKRCEPGLCRAAWEGYSYQWNDEGTEATLLENTSTTIFKDWSLGGTTQRHSYPGRDECKQCHAVAAGGVLGLQTGQLNRNYDYGGIVDNQLRALAHAGVFGTTQPLPPYADWPLLPTPSDAGYTRTERVRSYFHSNCSHCHRPEGRWPVIDFLYDAPLVEASLPNTNICNELVPGNASSSRLYIKDSVRDSNLPPEFSGRPMPPLASLVPDTRQLVTLKAWIDEMKSCP